MCTTEYTAYSPIQALTSSQVDADQPHRELERFEAALESLAARDDTFTRDAVNLAIMVDSAALFAIHEGHRPDGEQLRYLARTFSQSQSWAEIAPEPALELLTSLADQTPVQNGLSLEDLSQLVFVVGAWLLSDFLPGDKDWTDFLDVILDRIESAAEPQVAPR